MQQKFEIFNDKRSRGKGCMRTHCLPGIAPPVLAVGVCSIEAVALAL